MAKVHYEGNNYKVQEIKLDNHIMYVVARKDETKVFKAYDNIDDAVKQVRSMDKKETEL